MIVKKIWNLVNGIYSIIGIGEVLIGELEDRVKKFF